MQKLKELFYHTKIEVVVFHKINLTHICTIITENTEKFAKLVIIHNRMQNSEKISHLLFAKLAFSQVPQQLFYKQSAKLLLRKIIKAAIDCSYIYCEGRHGKVLQTHVLLFKCTIVFIGVINVNWHSITQRHISNNLHTKYTSYNKNIS